MLWVFAIPLTLLAAYAVYAAFKYTRMISTIFMGLVFRPNVDHIPTSRGEPLTILDSSEREIEALYLEKKGSKQIVIFCHESGGAKELWEKYASFLPDRGYQLLSVSFPENRSEDQKNSLTQWPEEQEVEKLITVIRWTKHAIAPDTRVALFGVSKGANLALAASLRDSSVKAVVADGLFSMKEIFRDYIRQWAPILVKPNLFGDHTPSWVINIFANLGYWHCQKRSGKRFIDVEELLTRRHVPVLMIHGADDDYISEGHQRFLSKYQKKGNTTHWVVEHAGHNQAVVMTRAVYEDRIVQFLSEAMA
jgi:predicted esterase